MEIHDDRIALLKQVSKGLPGALRVCMELCYEQEHPEALQKLASMGITGVELWLLYKACGYDSHAVLVALSTAEAVPKLRTNPESTFYQP